MIDKSDFDEIRRLAIMNENRLEGITKRVESLERKTGSLERAILGDRYTGGRAIREVLVDVEERIMAIELQNQRLRWVALGLLAGGTGLGAALVQLLGI